MDEEGTIEKKTAYEGRRRPKRDGECMRKKKEASEERRRLERDGRGLRAMED